MNIFVLDRDPIKAAQMMCDAHVVKMIVESCQLLSTNDRMHGKFTDPSGLYKSTHISHPCRMCLVSEYNRAWLICHLSALLAEYTYRFGKVHKSAELHHRYYCSEVFKPKIQDIFARASSFAISYLGNSKWSCCAVSAKEILGLTLFSVFTVLVFSNELAIKESKRSFSNRLFLNQSVDQTR